jgi:hypothetical protein
MEYESYLNEKTRNVPLNVALEPWTLIIIAFLIIAASLFREKRSVCAEVIHAHKHFVYGTWRFC